MSGFMKNVTFPKDCCCYSLLKAIKILPELNIDILFLCLSCTVDNSDYFIWFYTVLINWKSKIEPVLLQCSEEELWHLRLTVLF